MAPPPPIPRPASTPALASLRRCAAQITIYNCRKRVRDRFREAALLAAAEMFASDFWEYCICCPPQVVGHWRQQGLDLSLAMQQLIRYRPEEKFISPQFQFSKEMSSALSLALAWCRRGYGHGEIWCCNPCRRPMLLGLGMPQWRSLDGGGMCILPCDSCGPLGSSRWIICKGCDG